MQKGIRAIVGLGNPGMQYSDTRHNVGFACMDAVAQQAACAWKKDKKFKGEVSQFSGLSHTIYLLKPHTYMNLSGHAIVPWLHYYQLEPSELLVIHDDIELPFGQLRLKFSGGHGGHNGVRHLTQALGSNTFYRLRMGIGRPTGSIPVNHYVLSPFTAQEQTQLHELYPFIIDTLSGCDEKGFSQAMIEQFNRSTHVH